jgi:hypothetical protein
MYNFYTNMLPEKRDAWRNAYEIKVAALEHEKRRFENEDALLEKPWLLAEGNRQSGWAAIVQTPLRLITILIG